MEVGDSKIWLCEGPRENTSLKVYTCKRPRPSLFVRPSVIGIRRLQWHAQQPAKQCSEHERDLKTYRSRVASSLGLGA